MRDILFRGKRLDNGEWVYGVPIFLCKEASIVRDFCVDGRYTVPVEAKTVGQYTGLTANGKKIFEGDILQVSIYYDVGCYPHTDIKTIEVKIPDIYKINIEKCIEVNGNIYDNPELMEG